MAVSFAEMFVAAPRDTSTPFERRQERLSIVLAEKLTICDLKEDEKLLRYVFTATITSSVAAEPATGWTVAGTLLMRMQLCEVASASAASSEVCPLERSSVTGSIQQPSDPRYQATLPEFMRTMAESERSFTLIESVLGNLRSILI